MALDGMERAQSTPIPYRTGVVHQIAHTSTPSQALVSPARGWLTAKSRLQASLETPASIPNQYRQHGYRVLSNDPTSDLNAEQQYIWTIPLNVETPYLIEQIALSLVVDLTYVAPLVWGLGAVRPAGQSIDNVVLSVEAASPYAPNVATEQIPAILRRDFRLNGFALNPSNQVILTSTLPVDPGTSGATLSGSAILTDVLIPMPAGSSRIYLTIPAGAANGFQSLYPYRNAQATMSVTYRVETEL